MSNSSWNFHHPVAAVVIGRNEGDRLLRCLDSLKDRAHPIIYVDSGSTDESVSAARLRGAQVVELDMSVPFTAARARNAGLAALSATCPDVVQMVDADCDVQENWISIAKSFLDESPDVAMVAGRLRERFPNSTLWNALADDEWDTTPGEAFAVGGIAMLRRSAVNSVGGYRENLIAGEEPELCLRLRRKGWRIWVLPDEMARHDIAMKHFWQWWRRMCRSGYAFAEGVALHGSSPERYRVSETRRILFWGAALPVLAAVGAVFFTKWSLILILAYPAQVLRLRLGGQRWRRAVFLTVGKFPEVQGLCTFYWGRLRGKRRRIIEYK